MTSAAPTVEKLLSTLPKPRLVELGRQFGVAVAKPNGVPKNESVTRLVQSGQLVFRDLLRYYEEEFPTTFAAANLLGRFTGFGGRNTPSTRSQPCVPLEKSRTKCHSREPSV